MSTPTIIVRPRALVEASFADVSELDWLESVHDDLDALADFITQASPAERREMRACLDAWWLRPFAS